MALSIRYNNVNRQASGLAGRKTRTPLVKKYGDKIYGLNNRTRPPAPTLAAPAPPEPPVVKPRVPFDSGPGIGPGEGAVGGIEAGSTFGETRGEQLAMENMNAGSLATLPAIRGAKGAIAGAPLGLSAAVQMGLLSAIPAGMFSLINRGIPTGVAAETAGEGFDAALAGLDPPTADIAGQAAIDSQKGRHNPNVIAQTFVSPQQYAAQEVAKQQNQAPQTLASMAVRGIKGLAEPGPDPQIAVDPSQTGGFNFGGRSFGSGTSPGLDAAAQADIEGDPSLGMGSGGALAGNAQGGTAGGTGAGTATGRGDSVGMSGDAPGGAGTALCTSLYRQNIMTQELYLSDVNYAGTLNRDILDGYYIWASVVARWMDKSKVLTFILKWPIMQWAENMAFYGSGARVGKPTWFGRLAEFVGFPICKLISKKFKD
jgi:hypothetical protein